MSYELDRLIGAMKQQPRWIVVEFPPNPRYGGWVSGRIEFDDAGFCTETAPVFSWMTHKSYSFIKAWVLKKGGFIHTHPSAYSPCPIPRRVRRKKKNSP